ncbi:COG1361 S-layer family protein [Halohasta salina]|uniref:COG1361 S-layer family protein n=1 Tax=Halohasta salina TaxID=2961621 RepID=UPI0020A30E2B|nr:hypothetical protein [Halohasta salina]
MLVTGSVVSAQAGTIDAQGSPDINVYTPDNEVTPGTETAFTLQFDNDGEFIRGNEADRRYVTTARSVVTELHAEDAPIRIKTGTQSIGELSENEPRNIDFMIEVPDNAKPGTYEMEVDIDYTYTSKAEDQPGLRPSQTTQTRSITREIEIQISNDARFEVTEVDSTLRVGEEGKVTGQLENVGGEDATNAEVRFAPESETVVALESSVAVGDVPAGETVNFSIPVEVTSEAEAVPRRFDLPVSFRDENGIRQSDDDPEFLAEVAAKRDAFDIEPVDASVEAGGSRALDIEVTNQLDEPVTDVEGKLFADDPLDSSNDETFTESLEPGETTTVTVDLSADAGSTPKNYPVSMDFRYTDSDGDSKLSDSYRMAIGVTEAEDDGGLPIGTLLIGLVAVAGIGALLWRRNGGDIGGLN